MGNTIKNVGLNDVQIGLLRMFNRPMSIEESVEIRDLLTQHYANKLFDEVDRVVAEKGITEADYDNLRNEHQRTKTK
jgi:hypothetical protein